MEITLIGKYILGKPIYVKLGRVCQMHLDLDRDIEGSVKAYLHPNLITKYNRLPVEKSEIKKKIKVLHMIQTTIKYLLDNENLEKLSITQYDIDKLFLNTKDGVMCRICGYERLTDETIDYEILKTVNRHINEDFENFKMLCNGCSCINILNFNDDVFKKYSVSARSDLAKQAILSIDFQKYKNINRIISETLNELKSKLEDTKKKIIILLLGLHDSDSIANQLNRDIIFGIILKFKLFDRKLREFCWHIKIDRDMKKREMRRAKLRANIIGS